LERYPNARMVALSTGNVYPLVPVKGDGATEEHPLTPVGEYANAAVARERVFEYCARKHNTSVALLRLNYAVELRYGVLVDIARKVWAGETIDLSNGYFNCIWQGDANEMILRSLSLPAGPWNLTAPGVASVRQVAEQFGKLFSKSPQLVNQESDTALLNNPTKICARLGPPSTSLQTMIEWIAHWVRSGGKSLDKPTHFEVRDGAY
jgi:nucleoside-diphosphate-sugar epimerase